MKSADYVNSQLDAWKKAKKQLMWIAWQIALLCVGWAYVFGARGELCSPANRRAYYKSKGAAHPTIKTKCKGFDSVDCSGCKWYPDGQRTRFFDCRGFTYWIFYIVFGWKLQGAGATSQWNTAANWKDKGTIDTIPKDRLVCVFQHDKSTGKKKHTGLAYNGETVECQNGVQHFKKMDGKWTHWGLPMCCADGYVAPEKKPEAEKPKEDKVSRKTIRKGNMGTLVKECQQMLQKLGYDLGVCGADGDFGPATEKAVRAFQKAHDLAVDGVVGPKTWDALEKAVNSEKPKEQYYRVIISHLTQSEAEKVKKAYTGATIEKEG